MGTHLSDWGLCPFSPWVMISCCPALSRTDDTIQKYYFNITNHFSWSPVEVTLGLYTSLCQYFSEQERRWKTEGIVPLEETRPDQAVCLTQHLTAFGASLFVPPNSVQFIFPVSRTKQRLCGIVTSKQRGLGLLLAFMLGLGGGWQTSTCTCAPLGAAAEHRGAVSPACESWLLMLKADACSWLYSPV